jgi:tetraacyldisaccharide 4'-kinase
MMDAPARSWLRWLLAPPGVLYRSGVSLRNALYRRHLLTPRRVGIPVVSVGNLTAGGSGKTPFVAYLAGRFREAGRRVAVASRGYGGKQQSLPVTVSDGNGPLAGAGDVGDEPVLLATLLPSTFVVVCRDRATAALFARERFGADLVILDDGFQHRRIHRDLDLLLVDAADGLGNGRMMPFGPLREPLSETSRADALVITGAEDEIHGGVARIREDLRKMSLKIPVFACERRVEGFLRVETEEPVPPAALKGLKILAFSGIARPRAFESDLRSLGLNLAESIRFRDHQPLGALQMERIRSAARETGADLIVTTEKDRVRLGSMPFSLPLYAMRIRLVPREEEEFWGFVSRRLFPSSAISHDTGS